MWKKVLCFSLIGMGVYLVMRNKEQIMNFADDMYSKMKNDIDDMADEI